MPKLKTNRGATKRFKIIGSGNIKRAAANHNHMLTKKPQKRKRRIRSMHEVALSDRKTLRKMLKV